MSKIDDNGLEENKKSYIKYGGNLPGGKGHFLTSEPLTDDEIEEILKHGEEVKKENDMILKSSYGHNFVNVENLEKKKSHSSQFIWSPFVAYYGIDPENEQYLKKQVVSIHHVEGNIHECTPDSVHYRGTTHWYDGFAFEIKKEIRNSYSLEDLNKEKDVTTIN